MKSIKIKNERWPSYSDQLKDVYLEICPNEKCRKDVMLRYPTTSIKPYCPDCKTDLVGDLLVKSTLARFAYHKGG